MEQYLYPSKEEAYYGLQHNARALNIKFSNQIIDLLLKNQMTKVTMGFTPIKSRIISQMREEIDKTLSIQSQPTHNQSQQF